MDHPTASPRTEGHQHLVWHQELICPGESCRGRLRVFPPGVLVDGGRGERRSCPDCGAAVTAPAFYLGVSARGRSAITRRPADAPRPGGADG